VKRVNPSKITFASLEDLGKFLFRELQRLTATINENSELSQVVLAEEPTRPAIGKLAYADGENWNPGDGEGTYEYTSTGWVKLAGAAGSFSTTPVTVNVATPAKWAQITVVDAAVIDPTTRVSLFPGITAETDMNDWIEGDVVFKATPGTGQFVVDLYARDGSFLYGDYKLQYAVG